jgi:uncharacterized protein (TIGR04255 family)
MLVLQTGSKHDSQLRGGAFMLDLDFSTLPEETVTLDAAMEWVDQAHNHVESTFEACITQKARALFKEVSRDE